MFARGDSALLGQGASPTFADLAGALQFSLGDGRIWLNQDRMLLIQSASFGYLRGEMLDALGLERTRAIFRKMGWEQGIRLADVISQRFDPGDITAALAAGPRIHTMEGHVKVTTKRFEFDQSRGHYHGEFHWHDSSEADEHVARRGLSDCPVCWMLVGVPSGYTSRLLGHPVIFREIECVAQGAERCLVIGRNAESWGTDVPEMREFGLDVPKGKSKPWMPPKQMPPPRKPSSPYEILGGSAAITRARHLLEKVSGYDQPVMLLGEPGTGKERFAHRLHELGRTPKGPFITLDGGVQDGPPGEEAAFGPGGSLDQVQGGTLFLNDVLQFPASFQARLAQALRAETAKTRPGFRVVSATGGDPRGAVTSGAFRADLYYTLSLLPLALPPLRDRRDDLPILIEHFLTEYGRRHQKPLGKLSGAANDLLMRYAYPGNVRELSNMIERAVIYAEPGGPLESAHIFTGIEELPEFVEGLHRGGKIVRRRSDSEAAERRTMHEIECDTYIDALNAAGWNIAQAARELGMTRAALDYRIRKLGLRSEGGTG